MYFTLLSAYMVRVNASFMTSATCLLFAEDDVHTQTITNSKHMYKYNFGFYSLYSSKVTCVSQASFVFKVKCEIHKTKGSISIEK